MISKLNKPHCWLLVPAAGGRSSSSGYKRCWSGGKVTDSASDIAAARRDSVPSSLAEDEPQVSEFAIAEEGEGAAGEGAEDEPEWWDQPLHSADDYFMTAELAPETA